MTHSAYPVIQLFQFPDMLRHIRQLLSVKQQAVLLFLHLHKIAVDLPAEDNTGKAQKRDHRHHHIHAAVLFIQKFHFRPFLPEKRNPPGHIKGQSNDRCQHQKPQPLPSYAVHRAGSRQVPPVRLKHHIHKRKISCHKEPHAVILQVHGNRHKPLRIEHLHHDQLIQMIQQAQSRNRPDAVQRHPGHLIHRIKDKQQIQLRQLPAPVEKVHRQKAAAHQNRQLHDAVAAVPHHAFLIAIKYSVDPDRLRNPISDKKCL